MFFYRDDINKSFIIQGLYTVSYTGKLRAYMYFLTDKCIFLKDKLT